MTSSRDIRMKGVKSLIFANILFIIASLTSNGIFQKIAYRIDVSSFNISDIAVTVLTSTWLYLLCFGLKNLSLRRMKLNNTALVELFTGLFTLVTISLISISIIGTQIVGSFENSNAYHVCDPFIKLATYSIYIFLASLLITQFMEYNRYASLTQEKKIYIVFFIEAAVILAGIILTIVVQFNGTIDRQKYLILLVKIFLPLSAIDLVGNIIVKKIGFIGYSPTLERKSSTSLFTVSAIIYFVIGFGIVFFPLLRILGIVVQRGSNTFMTAAILGFVFIGYGLLCLNASRKAYKRRGLAIFMLLISLFSLSTIIPIFTLIGSICALKENKEENDYSSSTTYSNKNSSYSRTYSSTNYSDRSGFAKTLVIISTALCLIVGGVVLIVGITQSVMPLCLITAYFGFFGILYSRLFKNKRYGLLLITGLMTSILGIPALIAGVIGLSSRK